MSLAASNKAARVSRELWELCSAALKEARSSVLVLALALAPICFNLAESQALRAARLTWRLYLLVLLLVSDNNIVLYSRTKHLQRHFRLLLSTAS